MDLVKDFNFKRIELKPDYEGEVVATLISSKFNLGNRKAVLYVHGYIDYFFHPHLCEKYIENKFDFYALDLRKYGRSLLTHQHPNYCKDIEEYFEEISFAIRFIRELSSETIHLLGHSTGGLITSLYMNTGCERHLISGLILNSPFFDFNMSKIEKFVAMSFANLFSIFSSYSKIDDALSPLYAQSIHKDFYGEWDFNLDWKPIKGFPAYFRWLLAVNKAQTRLMCSDIKIPVLIMCSGASAKYSKFSEEIMHKDIVLNVDDIKRVGAKLANDVSIVEIKNAQHDIFLSAVGVREEAFNKMFEWINNKI